MEVIRGIQSLSKPPIHPVVTIGNFDGVHLGHQRIIAQAIEKARARRGSAVAYTFRPHPQVALRPEVHVPLLVTYDEKLELLAKQGIDMTIEEPFSRQFSTTSPEQFFNDVLLRRLNAEAIVVGYDFAFGKEREGQLERLEAFCKQSGVELTVVQPQRLDSEVVSSSRIRQHLAAGEVDQAAKLLTREFFYRGVVIKGEGRGRKIGFPTANLKLENKLALPYGVYSTWAALGMGAEQKIYPSVTNVGVRPTFQIGSEELPVLIETHLLDQTIDLYGSVLEIRFVKRIRDERRFSDISQLKEQIAKDVTQARSQLALT